MPDVVRAAVREALGGDDLRHEFAWMSWAGTVWRLEGKTRVVYVKRAAHLEGERDRLAWLGGRWPVPQLIGLFHGFGRSEERRGGKECRSRWAAYHLKKKQ